MDEMTPLGPEPGAEAKTHDALDEMTATADAELKTPLGRIVPKTVEKEAARGARCAAFAAHRQSEDDE